MFLKKKPLTFYFTSTATRTVQLSLIFGFQQLLYNYCASLLCLSAQPLQSIWRLSQNLLPMREWQIWLISHLSI